MEVPEYISLSEAYQSELSFSKELSQHLQLLEVGNFGDEVEVEALVGTRRADIVAKGNDGILVVENQFGKADWDHWGRLEAYARIKEASTAVLVAEKFGPLMIETCALRNQQDKAIDWYLVKAMVTQDKLHIFQLVSGPSLDIQAENTNTEYNEFWTPIRENGLFAGKMVPKKDTWISKGVKGAGIDLVVNQSKSVVKLYYKGDANIDKRDKAFDILAELEYEMHKHDSPKHSMIVFPVMDKGMKDTSQWDDIREKLVKIGTDIYNIIIDSEI